MLVLTRKAGEKVIIQEDIVVTILEVKKNGRVRIGITAPKEVPITRDDAKKGPKHAPTLPG